MKKNDSIQQRLVKNRSLSRGENNSPSLTLDLKTRAYGSRGCGTYPMVFRLDEDVFVNGMKVYLDRNMNCKSKNIIYLAQCSVFQADLAIELNTSQENVLLEDSYVGQL